MKPPRELKPEERALWRKVARTAKPLDPSRLAALNADKTRPVPDKARGKTPVAATPKPAPLSPPARSKPKPPPADRSNERRLRRGRVEIEARIDLHGMRLIEARAALGRFLHSGKARGLRTVLVITGKGLRLSSRVRGEGEAEPGAIRRAFPDWLAEGDLRHLVSGYAPAHARHGGTGAFYVTLRFPRE
ncbi:Smr/MutS family protein [Hyphobacterium marinum]|uniref:Smr/MutS family protein n=1 Tax=Hyphobacterium marinum TaxID=3116574 RepID=A0ABU7LUZ9_9PROT|nr:Smr/MutS family protein [Hyphobacterium sp. Y6023]MEE2565384.1 Smr/MutS family protein [Hyphobacterium sp. Y6023]